MPVNRSLWARRFTQNAFPGLPCPKCASGKLKLVKDSLVIKEPAFSKAQHSDKSFELDWIEQRFVAHLECDETDCGETVFIAGDTEEVETFIDEEAYSGCGLEEVLRVQCVFPAPPLFRIPDAVPPSVGKQLRLAFQLYWTDIASCVARLRTSVELMLNHQKVAKERLDKKSGKMVPINLHDRIFLFEKQASGADAAESLHALRNIGNLGTHGTMVSTDALFDAIDVLEDVLLGIYEKNSIKAKAKKLNDTKGDYD